MTTLAVFVGSLRAGSLNKKLAQNLERLASKDVRFDYVDLNLPLYNTDLESTFPESVEIIKQKVSAADGVLIITPEYNRSVPGVLKNAMDWVSRPYGDNSFDGKPLALAGASIGPIGTAVAQSDLRHIAGYLNMRLLGQPELYLNFAGQKFNDDGTIVAEAEEQLKAFMANMVNYIRQP